MTADGLALDRLLGSILQDPPAAIVDGDVGAKLVEGIDLSRRAVNVRHFENLAPAEFVARAYAAFHHRAADAATLAGLLDRLLLGEIDRIHLLTEFSKASSLRIAGLPRLKMRDRMSTSLPSQ